jgi:hypothetical protein
MLFKEMYDANSFESITVNSTATGLTAGNLNPAGGNKIIAAFITAETAQMRYRIDGTTALASTGHLLEVGDIIEVYGGNNLSNFSIVRTGSTSGAIKVTYFKG